MARLILSVICLALYFGLNPIDCETWGDISEKLDTNIDVKLVNNKTKVIQEIPSVITLSIQTKNATNTTNVEQKVVTVSATTTTKARTEIPKFVTLQPRIVPAAAPKAPAPAAAPKAPAPAAGTTKAPAAGAAGPKTITYKLGKRVAGITVIIT